MNLWGIGIFYDEGGFEVHELYKPVHVGAPKGNEKLVFSFMKVTRRVGEASLSSFLSQS